MKKIGILLLLLLGIGSVVSAQIDYAIPKTYTLEGITVEGCEYYDKNSVILKSDLEIGEQINIPGPQITDAVRNLWKENIFSDISIEIDNIVETKLFLVIRVEELPRISRTTFSGVTKSQTDDLREKIQFVRGTRWTEEKAKRAKRVIRNYFIEKGFYNTEIEITTSPDEFMSNGFMELIGFKNKGECGIKIYANDINIAAWLMYLRMSVSYSQDDDLFIFSNDGAFFIFVSHHGYIQVNFRDLKYVALFDDYMIDIGYEYINWVKNEGEVSNPDQ